MGVASSLVAYLITKDVRIGIFLLVALAIGGIAILPIVKHTMRHVSAIRAVRGFGVLNVYPNQVAAESAISSALERARTLDVLSLRGLGLLGLRDSLLTSAILRRSGDLTIRVLLLNPQSKYVVERCREVSEDVGAIRNGILVACHGLSELKRTHSVSIEVRLYDAPPVWRLIFMDDRLFMSMFVNAMHGHNFPMSEVVYTGPLSLYSGFRKHFETLWASSLHVTSAFPDAVSTESA